MLPYIYFQSLLEEMVKIIPADVSNRQILQYLQYSAHCEFKAYDFGYEGNMQTYQDPHPPVYNLENVKPQEPINFYYSDNDYFVSLENIRNTHRILGDRIALHRIKFPKFNHFDFIMSKNIKDTLHSCIVDKIEKYEGRSYNANLCNSFNKEPY